ncbi:MAG: hypothetical protein ABIV94_08040 [Acidimicrobiales bacterium]
MSVPVAARDEARHPSGPEPLWSEAWTFEFFAPDASIGGWVRLGLYPNLGLAWYHGLLVRSRRPPVSVSDLDVALPKGDSREIRAPGLWADHVCETPLEHWTVTNEAHGVAVDHPAELYATEPRGEVVPIAFDLEWETDGIACPDGPAGYEVPCVVHGEILVGDERVELAGWGHRGHAWGPCDFWSAAWTRVAGRLDDGTRFGGRAAGAAAELGPAGLPASATVEVGGLALTIAPLAFAPAWLTAQGKEARLARALCRFTAADGRTGLGWAEWNQPVMPDSP